MICKGREENEGACARASMFATIAPYAFSANLKERNLARRGHKQRTSKVVRIRREGEGKEAVGARGKD